MYGNANLIGGQSWTGASAARGGGYSRGPRAGARHWSGPRLGRHGNTKSQRHGPAGERDATDGDPPPEGDFLPAHPGRHALM